MDGQLILTYPWYFTLFCLLLGGGIAAWMYYRDKLLNEHRYSRYFLFVLRSLAIAAAAFLLLGPVWKGLVNRTEKPIVVYLEDASSSVEAFTPAADMVAYTEGREALLEALAADFEIEAYRFGSSVIPWDDSTGAVSSTSNLSGAINSILETHSYQDVGAIVLATDGIYNQGFNPAFTNLSASTSIYTIALGDSTPSRDLFVQGLQYPKVVYLGDRYQLDIEWGAYNLAGQSMTIFVRDEQGNELLRRPVTLDSDEIFGRESVVVDADRPGIGKVTVTLSTAADEDVKANNTQSAYVDVLDGRKKVLVLYDSPHPDVRAVKAVIDGNRNYEVDVEPADRFAQHVEDYDLVIFHGLPSRNDIAGRDVIDECLERGMSMVLVVSTLTDLSVLNDLQPLVAIRPSGSQLNEVQALLDPNFNEFQMPTGLEAAMRNYPPLIAPFADYTTSPGAQVIVWQRLGDINTGYPMIAFGQSGQSRILLVTGEGLWRWRMNEFARTDASAQFDAFINQLIQYVSVREDKRRFRLMVAENLFREHEAVRFSAELYNANYELVNDTDVRLRISGPDAAVYEFTMDKSLNAYTLDAGLLPVGNYTAVASTVWSGESYEASAKFTVREVQLETLHRQADHGMLFRLGAATGGAMYTPAEMGRIAADIQENVNVKPVVYQSEKTTPLIHFQWLFFILLGLLAVEWFVRKWLGGF